MASSLPRRLAVAAVGIPAAFALVRLGGWPLVVALQVLAVLGTLELFRLAEARGIEPLRGAGVLGALGAPALAFAVTGAWGTVGPRWVTFAAVGWVLLVMTWALAARAPNRQPLSAVAVTVFGVLYAGVLPAFLLLLRHSGGHSPWGATALVFLPLAVIWICDTAAMAGGAMIGGPKCAPVVSPNKTWAGTITGTAGGALAALAWGVWVLGPLDVSIGWVQLLLLGLVLSVVGQVGDLAESLFKREVGVKDSGGVFPGHGGVLDRLDSLYWALPMAAFMLSLYGVI